MRIVGYCLPKKNAEGLSPIPMSEFRGNPCRCYEINHNSKAILCLNPQGTGLASFDFDQIDTYFECDSLGGLLIPPNLTIPQQREYYEKFFSDERNLGRDMRIIHKMTIAISLSKGFFSDSLYFRK